MFSYDYNLLILLINVLKVVLFFVWIGFMKFQYSRFYW